MAAAVFELAFKLNFRKGREMLRMTMEKCHLTNETEKPSSPPSSSSFITCATAVQLARHLSTLSSLHFFSYWAWHCRHCQTVLGIEMIVNLNSHFALINSLPILFILPFDIQLCLTELDCACVCVCALCPMCCGMAIDKWKLIAANHLLLQPSWAVWASSSLWINKWLSEKERRAGKIK